MGSLSVVGVLPRLLLRGADVVVDVPKSPPVGLRLLPKSDHTDPGGRDTRGVSNVGDSPNPSSTSYRPYPVPKPVGKLLVYNSANFADVVVEPGEFVDDGKANMVSWVLGVNIPASLEYDPYDVRSAVLYNDPTNPLLNPRL